MAGLIGIGRQTIGQATGGFGAAAGLEGQRNAMNDQLAAARKSQRASMVTTGAGLGASIGVNNLMGKAAADASLKAALSAPINIGTGVGSGLTPVVSGELVTTGMAGEAIAAPLSFGGTATGAGATTAGATTAGATTAGATTTGATTVGATTTGASTGTMAGIGAVATPLLIGAGVALLLDSLFDIF